MAHFEEDGERPIEGEEPVDVDGGGVEILAILEAMLFASPEPLTLDEIAAALPEMDHDALERALVRLARALEAPDRGLKLERVAGGFRLVTSPELAAPLRALFRFRNQKRLTPATLDVLAIVAYAQPITAPEIQEIRGADPAYALRVLLDRKLLRIVGRKRVVGRPILYGTTRHFLLHFGLDSLEDLPPVEGYGTQVVPAQGRLFPVTNGGGDVEPLDDDEEVGEEGEGAPHAGDTPHAGDADDGNEATGEDESDDAEQPRDAHDETASPEEDPRHGEGAEGEDPPNALAASPRPPDEER